MCNCGKELEVAFYSELDIDTEQPFQDMVFATEEAACVDLRCKEDFKIYPGETQIIGTGLYVSIPKGYEMQIRPRSGISAKTGLIFKNTIGTIDSDYRGREIFVVWHNLGETTVIFKKFDRIAQAKIERVIPVKYVQVPSIQHLKDMGVDRGGGCGSTGLK